MIRNLLCALACLSLFGCVQTVTKVMPEYSKMNVKDDVLGVVLVKERLTVANTKDVVDDLGSGEPTEVLTKFFSEEFLKTAKKYGKFSDVVMMDNYNTATFKKMTVPISSKESMAVEVPSPESNDPPFMLVIDKIHLSRVKTSGGMLMASNGAMTTTSGSDNLALSGSFVLWDTKAQAIVSYGKFDESVGVFMMMTKDTWTQMVRKVGYKIFIGKPYGKVSTAS